MNGIMNDITIGTTETTTGTATGTATATSTIEACVHKYGDQILQLIILYKESTVPMYEFIQKFNQVAMLIKGEIFIDSPYAQVINHGQGIVIYQPNKISDLRNVLSNFITIANNEIANEKKTWGNKQIEIKRNYVSVCMAKEIYEFIWFVLFGLQ